MTRLLTRPTVVDLLDTDELIPSLRRAFEAYSREREVPAQRVGSPLPGSDSDSDSDSNSNSAMVLVPGLSEEIPAYSVKVHAKFPNANPPIRGLILLHDREDGELLAALDSTYITALRTGVAGALATDTLAPPDANHVAVIGAGTQATHTLRALAGLREFDRVSVYDTDMTQALRFARRMEDELGIMIELYESLEPTITDRGIIIAATWATEPVIPPEFVGRDAHITTLGSDQPEKQEVGESLLRDARLVVDDRDLVATKGVLAGTTLGTDAIAAELGEVLAGTQSGRARDTQRTIYSPVGLAFQDLVAAWQTYERALEMDEGTELDFLGEPLNQP